MQSDHGGSPHIEAKENSEDNCSMQSPNEDSPNKGSPQQIQDSNEGKQGSLQADNKDGQVAKRDDESDSPKEHLLNITDEVEGNICQEVKKSDKGEAGADDDEGSDVKNQVEQVKIIKPPLSSP